MGENKHSPFFSIFISAFLFAFFFSVSCRSGRTGAAAPAAAVRFPGLVPWLMESLKTEGAGVERAGAAQGLCEVVTALGVQRLESLLVDILNGTRHAKVRGLPLPRQWREKFG